MSKKIYLTVQHQNNKDYKLIYDLADNPIAEEWIKKLKNIHRVPLDRVYTINNDKAVTKEEVTQEIIADITTLNNMIGKIYDIKTEYNQLDCNLIHGFTVSNQYSYIPEVRAIFHSLHRRVHHLENLLENSELSWTWLQAEWGEKSGPLTTKHKVSPYNYYETKIKAGNIYQPWAEFGKTPYTYWKNKDLDNVDNFLNNCKPHTTFRPGFSLCTIDRDYSLPILEFESWFDAYRSAWQERYNAPEMSAYSKGGVLLATPAENYDIIFSELYTIKSIGFIA